MHKEEGSNRGPLVSEATARPLDRHRNPHLVSVNFRCDRL